MRLFDTHTHLLDGRFDEDRERLAKRLPAMGIEKLLEAATSVPQSQDVLAFVSQHPYMACALGTHPHDAQGMCLAHMDTLRGLLDHEKAVAVGEIGLDYHYDFSPREIQRKWFIEQLELAQQLDLPVVLHMREASSDALEILGAHKNGLRGVMHCFSGSYETAKTCIDMGLYIAFGGALTFQNAKKAVDAASKLPMERLLIETDCPYMTPAPHRGKRNDPSLVSLVCEKLAAIKGIDPEEMAAITMENANALFW